jgi:SAM-dependent methyltransferase
VPEKMTISTITKKVLLKINPFYRMLYNIRLQLENNYNSLTGEISNIRILMENMQKIVNMNDESYLHTDAPMANRIKHSNWIDYLVELGNKENMKILEVGSRMVLKSNFRKRFPKAQYIGFDYYSGDNVDVVGDAHRLSAYFEKGEKFDIIFLRAVFEHFAMPWIVAQEISKLLKVGGFVFVETHFSYSSHERPWHFFQFSDMALKALFSPAMGFECIEAGYSNPIIGRFSSLSDEHLKYKPVTGLYCHIGYLGKKFLEVENFQWDKVNLSDVVGNTKYPEVIK